METTSNLYVPKAHKILFSGSLFLLLCAGTVINITNYLNLTLLKVSLFSKTSYSTLLATTLFIFVGLIFFFMEINRKWLVIRLHSSQVIEISSLFRKYELKQGEARFSIKKVFSRRGTRNEVIQVKLPGVNLEISEFYMCKYNELKKELVINGFIADFNADRHSG